MIRQNIELTTHFNLHELTVTNNQAKQDANRDLTDEQVDKLCALARHGEAIREICGALPLRIHSAYRSPALNSATVGASNTSQHPLCEAIDFDVIGQDLETSFTLLWDAVRAGRLPLGQLIVEEAPRGTGVARWIHCSAPGNLPPAKRGLIMRMLVGTDGKRQTTVLEQVRQPT